MASAVAPLSPNPFLRLTELPNHCKGPTIVRGYPTIVRGYSTIVRSYIPNHCKRLCNHYNGLINHCEGLPNYCIGCIRCGLFVVFVGLPHPAVVNELSWGFTTVATATMAQE